MTRRQISFQNGCIDLKKNNYLFLIAIFYQ